MLANRCSVRFPTLTQAQDFFQLSQNTFGFLCGSVFKQRYDPDFTVITYHAGTGAGVTVELPDCLRESGLEISGFQLFNLVVK